MFKRFCILLHDYPWWHWDFLIENGEHALCWRLLRQPCCDEPIAAQQLPAHRLMYMDYEGPVSRNRGVVQKWCRGTCAIEEERPQLVLNLYGVDWADSTSLAITIQGQCFWRFQKILR